MEQYQREFIDFMIRCGVLRFGEFTAKSGRQTPYFIDTSRYTSGTQIESLGRYYAQAIERSGLQCDVLFGPAYKGIPLVVSTAIALKQEFGRDVDFCFNRKEAKDHGEGGVLVGRAPEPGMRVLILEDVTTAGTSIRETVPLLQRCGDITLAGLIVSVDRMERGTGERAALSELADTYRMPCQSIVSIAQILQVLGAGHTVDGQTVLTPDQHAAVLSYLQRYGGKP